MKEELNKLCTSALTYRDALKICFNDNWDNRRIVKESPTHDVQFTASVWIRARVPMHLAKEALADLMDEELAALQTNKEQP